jgi:putative flavoprotein involved in K+ transport
MEIERFDTIVIGGGQAGLVTGYHLQRAGRSFAILEGNDRIGDNWRQRYASLRLFTPAYGCSLDGMRFPRGVTMPTKDEFADYLEAYAARFALPIRTGVRVDGLRRDGDLYVLSAGDARFEALNVVITTGAHRTPRVPAFARDLDPAILQVHSSEYRDPSQLRDGRVLVVGLGNSGGDISLEVSRTHPTIVAGKERGHIPADIDGWVSRHIVFHLIRFFGRHVLTRRNPIGRRAMAKGAHRGDPLVRVKPKQLSAASIERVGRIAGSRGGMPLLDDGRALDDIANVIWCVGFRHDLSWVSLPIFDEDGAPTHERGVVTSEPGLYFVGLPFQFSFASDVIPGVSRDARWVVKQLVRRSETVASGEMAVA